MANEKIKTAPVLCADGTEDHDFEFVEFAHDLHDQPVSMRGDDIVYKTTRYHSEIRLCFNCDLKETTEAVVCDCVDDIPDTLEEKYGDR
jgi:hypothetical protein